MTVAGLLLAAGAGTRMGMPKALCRDADGTSWLQRSIGALVDGGCAQVTVVLGARADEARGLVPEGVDVAVAIDWDEGLAASLRAGLAALDQVADAAVLSLVDLNDVTSEVVARVVADGVEPDTLSRAAYDGRPGHPVVIGRDHWAGVAASAAGDFGARHYLDAHDVTLVECGDLATGEDADSPRWGA